LFDIDTHADLAAARAVLERRQIFFRVVVNEVVGSGHLYRCLALAAELDHHAVRFSFIDPPPSWVVDLVRPWPIIDLAEANLEGVVIVNDTLDTTATEMAQMKASGAIVVGFEDLGPGAKYADLLVNDLYPVGNHPNERTGPLWAVMRPEFAVRHPIRDGHNRLLITFGGVDPAGITERASAELAYLSTILDIRVIPPPGRVLAAKHPNLTYVVDPAMSAEIAQADLVLTSGGRTVWEAAAMGVPVVSILQNAREQAHTHLRLSDGVVNLGPSQLLPRGEIRRTIESLLLSDGTLLSDMRSRIDGLTDGKGARRVAGEIERLIQ